MNSEIILRNFFLSLSTLNFDELFYNAHTGNSLLFTDVFPKGNYSIIGNSPNVLEHKNGFNIDQSDNVIRFNNFQIKNYEYSVGTKTNIWITSGGKRTSNELPNCVVQKKILVMNNYKSFNDKQLKIIEKYTFDNLSSFIILHNEIFLNKLITLLQGIPTTGFIILLLLAAKYKNINTYGFSFGEHKKKYHYYNDNVKQDSGHKWSIELSLFKILLSKKMLENKDYSLHNLEMQNNYKIFYEKNLPKHVKILNKQRTLKYNNYSTVKQNENILKVNNANSNNANSNNIVNDTNNKLLELNKLLNIS
jgi:hypothetical protein